MKKPITTEQILSPLGNRIGLRYHYEDGTIREVIEGNRTPQEVQEDLNNVLEKFNSEKK